MIGNFGPHRQFAFDRELNEWGAVSCAGTMIVPATEQHGLVVKYIDIERQITNGIWQAFRGIKVR
jgi:hypothetical protein